MLQRVLATINKIITENTDNVVIVTHSAVIMCLQCFLTNTPFEEMINLKLKTHQLLVDAFHQETIPLDYVKNFAKAIVKEGVIYSNTSRMACQCRRR